MDKIEYFKEISRLTSDLGVAITFMIVFLFIFLIFSIVLSVQLPKIINNYLSKKNEQRKRELERDKERWDKHVDLTEQGWRVIGQNDELLFHVGSEQEKASGAIKELKADFNLRTHHIDDIQEDTECILEDTKVLKVMLTDIYKSLEIVKRNSEKNKQTDEAVARIEQSISQLLIYLQEREEI
ncbi:MAG TPA: hypothetical protein IAC41_09045 [Candidatus Merdenecus merdavium]|nr:hypothetical protein [Candidatus Merdenecus merdavium]